jgi:hypothetical protein
VTGSSSKVEISQAKVGIEGDKGLNFITTGHLRGKEPGMSALLSEKLYYGYNVRELNHTHPFTAVPSDADLQNKNQVTSVFKNQHLRIPMFNIFYIHSKTYIQY